jgi:glutathione S-transferase
MTATVSTFGWVPPFAVGYVRDNRVRWALEELGERYETFVIDNDSANAPDYRAWQPFGQVPAYRDQDVELFESGAIVLHIARKSELLAPRDEAGFSRVTMWVIAELNSVEPQVANFATLDIFHAGEAWVEGYRPVAERLLRMRLASLSGALDGKDYLEGRFTVGDIMMSTVLRQLNETGVLDDFPVLAAYLARCEARPAWKRALAGQMETYRANQPREAVPA